MYTSNYEALADTMLAEGSSWSQVEEHFVALFETENAGYLQALVRKDVGAVMCYMDSAGLEQAYFDYERFVGSIYALTGQRSDE